MTYKIKKGKHRAWPPHFGFFWNKKRMGRYVVFTDSCRYTLPGGDQDDTNKLFGIGYFWFHHDDSARFGWWYNPVTDRIAISAYCWIDGEPVYLYNICEVELNKQYVLSLEIKTGLYCFNVYHDGIDAEHQIAAEVIPFYHKKKPAYPLGVFFGGGQPAPHDIKIKIWK